MHLPKILTKKHFRTLIFLDAFVLICIIVATVSSSYFLPPEWQVLVTAQMNEPLTLLDTVIGLFALVVGGWSLQNWHALYHFKPYARRHLVILTALSFVASAVVDGSEPHAIFGVELALYTAAILITGLQIALAYYSPLAVYFEPKAENAIDR